MAFLSRVGALARGKSSGLASGSVKTWHVHRGLRSFASTAGGKAPKDRLAVLCILDGWGYREQESNNSVLLANTPNYDSMMGYAKQRGRSSLLWACEKHVGLPEGQIGNSEVGHMNIGAGRVVYQDICTIDNAIEEGSLATSPALVNHIQALKKSGGTCHLMGLVSPGGVHAMQNHIAELANVVNAAGVPVVIHAFTDGRDVPPQDVINTMPKFIESLDDGITIGTVIGRYYAMDRDNRWERVGAAYDAMVSAKGVAEKCNNPMDAIKQSYAANTGDEFILPTVIGGYNGMKDGDGILMANFRADRAREILLALADPEPSPDLKLGSERAAQPKFANVAGMVKYSDRHEKYMGEPIFPEKDIQKPLGEVAADHGLRQLRIAETEKYPHVTFFFNGGREVPFENEDRILVPSPKVATYDLQPEMSCPEVAEKLCEAIDSGKYNMVIINFANPDMVGHTGFLDAAIKSVEACDDAIGKLVESVKRQKGTLIVTADHGNCETMWDDEINEPHTAHTLNRVACILNDFSGEDRDLKLNDGALCDLAPTMCELLGIQQPEQMTGTSLIQKS